MGRVVNRSELATTFGVSLPTIDNWLSAGMPFVGKPERKGQSGWRIDLAAVLEWHRRRERESALGEIANIDEHDARRRKMAAEAALAEHELAVKTGQALAVADWQATLAVVIGNARAKLLGLASKIGPRVAIENDAAECEAITDEYVREVLSELSVYGIPDQPVSVGESQDGSDGNACAMGASAGPDRQRVGRRRTAAVERK